MTLIKEKKYFSELLKEANDSDNPAASLKAAAAEDKRIIAILGYAANPSFRISTQMPEVHLHSRNPIYRLVWLSMMFCICTTSSTSSSGQS